MPQCTFEELETVVRRFAAKAFRRKHRREELTEDAVSIAWELFQQAPAGATARSLANYALRRLKSGRHFPESELSVDGPPSRYCRKPLRVTFSLELIARVGDDPAEIGAFRVDFRAWCALVLTKRQKAILKLLATGETTSDVAALLGCSAGRVSQFRRWLMESWHKFTA